MSYTTQDRRSPFVAALGGAAHGMAWGVAARAWMRLIAEEPEFSWGGTAYIVAVPAIIGLLSGVVVVAGQRRSRAFASVPLRIVAVAATVLLGMGAGALTLPSVAGAAGAVIAYHRYRGVAVVLLILAAVPFAFVARGLAAEGELRFLVGIPLYLALIVAIVPLYVRIYRRYPKETPCPRNDPQTTTTPSAGSLSPALSS